MPRTLHRPTAVLASLALALATAATVSPATASPPGSAAPATIDPAAVSPSATLVPGTLVFIKGFNVWMSRSDGSGQVQVTKDGSSYQRYYSPTMSDNGVITALRDTDVIRMQTTGAVLSSFDVGTLLPVADGGLQSTSTVHTSPDGTKVTYDQTSWKGMGHSVQVGTRFSASDRWSSAAEQEISRSDPKWVTGSRVVLRAWNTIYLRDLASSASVEWFTDDQVFGDPSCEFMCWSQEQYDPEVSRDGSRLVTMRAPIDAPFLITYKVTGDVKTSVPPVPQVSCTFGTSETDDAFHTPTIAPNNRSIAWQMAAGIYVKANMDNCEVDDVALAIPGGSEPSWSAAAYKAPSVPAPSKKIVVTKSPSISGTAKVGKTLKTKVGSWSPAPTRYSYQWKRNGKAISKATKPSYKLTKSDAGKKITVTVTASRTGYTKAAKTTKSVTVAAHNLTKPAIKKKPTARVGRTLKVSAGKWAGKPKLSYQWYRGSKKIKGATKTSYKVTRADRGKKLRVKVTAKRSGALSTSVWTARTKKIR